MTRINNAKPNHPNTIAVVPTPDLTLPFAKSCAMILAATDAVCCQRTETRTKILEMKIMARETWQTGREGIGCLHELARVLQKCELRKSWGIEKRGKGSEDGKMRKGGHLAVGKGKSVP